MQRFQFKLETLVHVRHRHEEQARLHFSRSIRLLNTEKLQLTALEQQAEKTCREWQQALGEKKTIDDFTFYSAYLHKLALQSEEQKQAIVKAQQFYQECLLAYQEALKKRKIIERLKEKQRQQHIYKELGEEQHFLDEIATQRYQRNR